MLFNAETISAIVRALRARYRDVPPVVCDPVCVSTSGHTLLLPEALDVMMHELFPLATIVTPNKSEAEALLACGGRAIKITSIEDMILASTKLVECGCRAVLLKGGHITTSPSDIDRVASAFPNIIVKRFGLPLENTEILQAHGGLPPCERVVVDVLCKKNGEIALFARPQIESKNTHGTGCTLSSALACELARGAGRKWVGESELKPITEDDISCGGYAECDKIRTPWHNDSTSAGKREWAIESPSFYPEDPATMQVSV